MDWNPIIGALVRRVKNTEISTQENGIETQTDIGWKSQAKELQRFFDGQQKLKTSK